MSQFKEYHAPPVRSTHDLPILINTKELAAILRKSVASIHIQRSRFPDSLPPSLNLPGKKIFWDLEEVKNWLNRHRSDEMPSPPFFLEDESNDENLGTRPGRKGRLKKEEEVARRRGRGGAK
ncbi:MAG: hypothetical protein D084_Lepto4C00431G0003 [Leptospirillum sp. Group IV 'UBA BS']|nr:MAG: hypothetical protein D084_Lepto4C00431G0003 [Leptospirillum sp. Group IV 'UBA BS']